MYICVYMRKQSGKTLSCRRWCNMERVSSSSCALAAGAAGGAVCWNFQKVSSLLKLPSQMTKELTFKMIW